MFLLISFIFLPVRIERVTKLEKFFKKELHLSLAIKEIPNNLFLLSLRFYFTSFVSHPLLPIHPQLMFEKNNRAHPQGDKTTEQ